MRVGATSTAGIVIALIACRSDPGERAASPLETSIAKALGARLGVPVVANCLGWVACSVRMPEGDRIPIVTWPAAGGWEWRVDGLLVTSDVLETYLRDEVAAMGAAQDVRCAPKLRRIAANDRVECWLANGGKAFVTVRADGSTSVEVALDKAAADARSEVITPARDEQMGKTSRALEHAEGGDGETETTEVKSAP